MLTAQTKLDPLEFHSNIFHITHHFFDPYTYGYVVPFTTFFRDAEQKKNTTKQSLKR